MLMANRCERASSKSADLSRVRELARSQTFRRWNDGIETDGVRCARSRAPFPEGHRLSCTVQAGPGTRQLCPCRQCSVRDRSRDHARATTDLAILNFAERGEHYLRRTCIGTAPIFQTHTFTGLLSDATPANNTVKLKEGSSSIRSYMLLLSQVH
jgi:hypothetical protein